MERSSNPPVHHRVHQFPPWSGRNWGAIPISDRHILAVGYIQYICIYIYILTTPKWYLHVWELITWCLHFQMDPWLYDEDINYGCDTHILPRSLLCSPCGWFYTTFLLLQSTKSSIFRDRNQCLLVTIPTIHKYSWLNHVKSPFCIVQSTWRLGPFRQSPCFQIDPRYFNYKGCLVPYPILWETQ